MDGATGSYRAPRGIGDVQRLGPVPGLTAVARSIASDRSGLSGNWCDMRLHSAGHAVVVVGDVAGHGAQASAAKRDLRPALRELVMHGEHPSVVVKALDALTSSSEAGMATMLYGVIDPARRSAELFNAGHPPPLIVDPRGVARYVRGAHFPPLGSGFCLNITSSHCYLEAGSTLIVYTDGLVARRGEDLADGLDKLQRMACGSHRRSVDEICDLLLGEHVSDGTQDDLTVVVIRLREEDP